MYEPQAFFQNARSNTTDAVPRGNVFPPNPEEITIATGTDFGNGKCSPMFKDRARYVPDRAKWFVFDGKAWRPDVGGLMAMQLCKQLADDLMVYALSIEDEKQRRAYIDHVGRWQKRSYRDTILKDAAGVHPVPFAAFDCQRNLSMFEWYGEFRYRRILRHRPEDFYQAGRRNYDPFALTNVEHSS